MSLTSVNKLENNTVELVVSVSEEQFQDALNKAYKKKVKSIALPGFRKGKAPKAMIEKCTVKNSSMTMQSTWYTHLHTKQQ